MSTETPDPTDETSSRCVRSWSTGFSQVRSSATTSNQPRRCLPRGRRAESPNNSELLDYAPQVHREVLEEVRQRKPERTASGVSPNASCLARRCPHGKCLYCPGGPDSEFSSPSRTRATSPRPPAASRTTTTPTGRSRSASNSFDTSATPWTRSNSSSWAGR